MRSIGLIGAVGLVVASMFACSEPNPATVGINVEVRDVRTGTQAWAGATVTARDGDYVETVKGAGPPDRPDQVMLIGLAVGRPGTYDVTVTHPDYEPWFREGVRVAAGSGSPFHPGPQPATTVYLVAELEPLNDGG